jgi:hypothetical protein
MGKYIGRLVSIGVAPEATRGVGVAATHSVPVESYDFFDKTNKAVSEERLGSISGNGNQAIVTQQHSEGSIDGEVNLRSFPLFLYSTFGTLTSAAQGAGFKHTVVLNNTNQSKTLSVHIDEANGDRLIKGAMVDSLEVSVTPENIVKFNAGFKGRKLVDNVFTPAFVADYKVTGRDLTLKVADATTDLAAATAISTKELSLTINKNTEFDFVNGTLEPEDIHNKQITIEGMLTLNYEDNTWRDYMLNGNYKAMSILLVDSRDDLGGGVYPALYLEFPRIDFSQWERPTSNNDIVTQKINFRVLYNITTSKLISDCYVINNVTSY